MSDTPELDALEALVERLRAIGLPAYEGPVPMGGGNDWGPVKFVVGAKPVPREKIPEEDRPVEGDVERVLPHYHEDVLDAKISAQLRRMHASGRGPG